MTDIYLHIVTRTADYMATHPNGSGSRGAGGGRASDGARHRLTRRTALPVSPFTIINSSNTATIAATTAAAAAAASATHAIDW